MTIYRPNTALEPTAAALAVCGRDLEFDCFDFILTFLSGGCGSALDR
jgi:hypothetical protein